jgi:hypothetical protein
MPRRLPIFAQSRREALPIERDQVQRGLVLSVLLRLQDEVHQRERYSPGEARKRGIQALMPAP